MWQRIQSLYLAVAAVAGILAFFFPLAFYYHELQGNYRFYLYGMESMDPEPAIIFSRFFTLPMIVMASASVALSLITIFLFRRRMLQVRLCAFNVLANMIVIMLVFFYYAPKIRTLTSIEPEYSYAGMLMPLIALVALIMATRAIRKDEALVKSADRIR